MEDRFHSKVIEREDGCWEWKGTMTDRGYGGFWDGKSMRRAHVVAYEIYFKRVGQGLELDHLCRNRWCVKPDHLEEVTHKENMHRAHGSKTHCKHGHEFTPENTKYYKTQYGFGRMCRSCHNRIMRERRLRLKQSVLY